MNWKISIYFIYSALRLHHLEVVGRSSFITMSEVSMKCLSLGPLIEMALLFIYHAKKNKQLPYPTLVNQGNTRALDNRSIQGYNKF